MRKLTLTLIIVALSTIANAQQLSEIEEFKTEFYEREIVLNEQVMPYNEAVTLKQHYIINTVGVAGFSLLALNIARLVFITTNKN